MANIASISSSAGGAIWQQLQSQQLRQEAEQASQTAQALQSQARSARAAAQRASESARALEVQASQAQSDAAQASMNVQRSQSVGEMQTKLDDVYARLPQMVTRGSTPSAQTPVQIPTPTVAVSASSTEPTVGTVINTTA